MWRAMLSTGLACLIVTCGVTGQDQPPAPSQGDRLLTEYFNNQVSQIESSTFADIESLQDWEAKRSEYRRQLAEMLGLDPMPEKTPLHPVITGTVDHDEFTVENLHFQSRPGLYVTGNLYIPKGLDGPVPTVLYVCGHARVKEDGVSYGNKVAYQHHGIWFARHGYVCLTIDTLQLGEIEGLHHGTYREGMWWWQSRGYTPAGVEAWNCIRALDYLETRPEVDASRIGVTGRSGGGAYSWWIAALDERIRCAVPVAGIASLRNHLLGPYQTSAWNRRETNGHDGCIEGHCDCMYFINTYRWDFPLVAALVAPRPLLISNTDKDSIFPLDGVYDVYKKTQKIYELYDATDQLGLQICEGPHKDTQQLRVHAFQWMNRHLKGDEPLIDVPAEKLFEPQQLRVFDQLPQDQRNTSIQESFVSAAQDADAPETEQEWTDLRQEWMTQLEESVFRGWPADRDIPLQVEQVAQTAGMGLELRTYEYTSQEPWRLTMLIGTREGADLAQVQQVVLVVLDETSWADALPRLRGWFPDFLPGSGVEPVPPEEKVEEWIRNFAPDDLALVALLPRGVGPTAWTSHEKERIHIRRRFALLGQTLDGMRAWDAHRGLLALRAILGHPPVQLEAQASGDAVWWLLAASLFDETIDSLKLGVSDADDRPVFLNISRQLPRSALFMLAADDTTIELTTDLPDEWQFAREATEQPWFEAPIRIRSRKPAGRR